MKLRLTSVNELLHIIEVAKQMYDVTNLNRIIDYKNESIKGLKRDYRYYSFDIQCDRKSMIVSFIRLEECELRIECPFNRDLDFELLKILKDASIEYEEYNNTDKQHMYILDVIVKDKENNYFLELINSEGGTDNG